MNRSHRIVVACAALCAVPAIVQAQAGDSVRKFSLFAGTTLTDYTSTLARPNQFEAGGSVDFRVSAFPVALRATMAFSQEPFNFRTGVLRFGTLSLDAVTHPMKGLFGVHPYLLGGVGLGTRAEYTFFATRYVPVGDQMVASQTEATAITQPRLNWAYAEGGGGLEFGRLFLQAKLQTPVASNGPTRISVSIGFKF